MLYKKERRKILKVLEDMKRFHYIDPTGGDLSMRVDEKIILSTPTGSAFRRWNIEEKDLIVLSIKGKIIEKGDWLAPVETPLVLEIYKSFKKCGAVVHSHAPYASTFASLNKLVPSTTNLMDTLGEVPCFYANDLQIKEDVRSGKVKLKIPEAMVQRPDVAAIFLFHIIPQFGKKFLSRKKELEKHGLAFTIYKHGLFAFARNIDEAFENLARVEFSARVAIYQGCLAKN